MKNQSGGTGAMDGPKDDAMQLRPQVYHQAGPEPAWGTL